MVIPGIVKHRMERYASACLQWVSSCENYNKEWFMDGRIIPILETMAESHKLKSDFCDGKNIQKRSAAAL